MERKNCYKCLVMSNCKQVPCPRTLSLRWNASVVLVITRRAECTAWQSTPMRFLSLAMERSDRSNLLTSHTCFFDYFATLVMTKAKIATLRSRWQFTLRSWWQLVCTLATRNLSLRTLQGWSNLLAKDGHEAQGLSPWQVVFLPMEQYMQWLLGCINMILINNYYLANNIKW